MTRYAICVLIFLFAATRGYAQTGAVTGTVLDEKTKRPVSLAVISADQHQLWAVADAKGRFTFANMPHGKTTLSVSCLGYAARKIEITVTGRGTDVEILLNENNLVLRGVTVSARRKSDDATTSYIIDRTAIDHMQATSVTDVSALLPGGQTSLDPSLGSARRFVLRAGPGPGVEWERGYSSFGTAVEVDGVRLSTNASFYEDINSRLAPTTFTPSGVDVRNISSSNVESIEIITGVASVEHGDMTNGMVKINTLRGRTPFTAEFVTKPNIKQYTLGKGLALGQKGGILNVHAERTESTSDIASPYTTYDRNVLSLNYSNAFSGKRSSLRLRAGFSGNIGGYDTEPDPDLFQNTYTKVKDNAMRAHIDVNWLLNRRWITNVEASISANYSNKDFKRKDHKSSAAPSVAIHATEEGYYFAEAYDNNPDAAIVLRPEGSWYEVSRNDSRQVTYTGKAKATWVRRFGPLNNRIMIGGEYTSSGNEGKGTYYDDYSLAPTWREQRYSDLPTMHNIAAYAEERADIALGSTALQLTAGLRSEWTAIKGSEYGTVNSLSPRFNLKYDIPFGDDAFIRGVTLRAGYGKAVKLPSFQVLYPLQTYSDQLVFNPLGAYYSYPREIGYNPDLKWQNDRLMEIGLDVDIKGVLVSLSFFNNKTRDPYVATQNYTPSTYRYTSDSNLDQYGIASENRVYTIDRQTGQVTLSDRTGTINSVLLPYTERNVYRSSASRGNGSPIVRRGLEWVVDFPRIESIRTQFRVDGKYYYYKGTDETVYSTTIGTGPSYKYLAYYVGTASGYWNGSISRHTNLNLTVTTHIPEARLIVSLRVESSLYRMSRYISEYKGNTLAFVIDDPSSFHPTTSGAGIYDGNQYVGVYPLYYTTHDDPNTKIPFAEKFEWARDNDEALYNELKSMVNRTTVYNFQFNKNTTSPYFTANLAVTKEIGKIASLTFNATNFFNNTARVRNGWTGTEESLYDNFNRVPSFYYGLSLRLKL